VKLIDRLASDRHQTRLDRMLVLTVTALLAIQLPSVSADQLEYLRHLHPHKCDNG
jgi:hypothetical protein